MAAVEKGPWEVGKSFYRDGEALQSDYSENVALVDNS